MIDTSKYEGHTPDEWIVEQGANGDTLVSSFHPNENGLQTDIALVYSSQADAQLMADAPLLLAEVKRLREVIKKIKELSEGWLRWDERGIKMGKIIMELIE